ncbi:MAG TPA: D-aminoacylase, partial [Lentzea sp.]|nr:D-aminoacylase [Lentzea sp.]
MDIVFRGARVVDGTGAPEYRADVGVRDGRIAAVGVLDGAEARQRIDARGQVVTPGFIDAHSHSDLTLLSDPR